jgi:uncharacterized protein
MNEYEFVLACEQTKKEIIDNFTNLKKRDIFFEIDEEINSFIKNKNKRIFLFYGLRGIGKSTTLYQILKEHKKIMFIDGTNINYNNLDLLKVFEEYKKIVDYKILIIDELNDIKNWGDALKIIHDLHNVKIIATGSSAIKIKEDLDVIIRRAKIKKISPLSFKEYLYIEHDIEIDIKEDIKDILFSEKEDAFIKAKEINKQVLDKDSKILIHFKEYLKYGYPLLFNKENNIEEVAENIIYKIIVDDFKSFSGFNIDSLEKSKKIIKYLSTITPGVVSYDKISKFVSFSKNSVVNVLNAFFVSGLLIEILSESVQGSIRKEPKILFSSSAIRYGLEKKIITDVDVGFLREDAFVTSMVYNDIGVSYLKLGKKQPDYKITYKDKQNIIEVGGPGKSHSQIKKGILALDGDKINVIEDVVTIPLYLICLI